MKTKSLKPLWNVLVFLLQILGLLILWSLQFIAFVFKVASEGFEKLNKKK